MSQVKHNALSQKMGDIYHYYIAIDLFFKIDNWEKCEIETQGDIAFFDKHNYQILNIEVKHHLDENELKIYDEEFQKTLYNWFNIKEKFNEKTKLQLLTTSNISKNNPLYHWNNFSSEEKYKTILENQKKANSTYYVNIEKYFFKINKEPDEIKKLLNKVEIYHSMLNIDKIKENILKNKYFDIFKTTQHKNEVINSLYGLIAKGLKDKEIWRISRKEFSQKIRELSSFAQSKILRTDNDTTLEEIPQDKREIKYYKDKLFVKKLEKIELNDKVFRFAIDDYTRTILEASKRMNLTNSNLIEYKKRLSTYENSLIRKAEEVKTQYIYEEGDDIKKSQKYYFEIMKSDKIPFIPEEFDDKTTFFQKGYFHILADDEEKPKQICWSLKLEDLI